MGIDIKRNIYRPMQDMTFAAATHLVLPLHNDAVTPTLGFGDGGFGLYASDNDQLVIGIAGSGLILIRNSGIQGSTSNSGFLKVSAASATDPVHTFNADDNTGIGNAAADQLSLIAGAIEGLRITEANGVANMNIVCHEGAVVTHNDNVVTLN